MTMRNGRGKQSFYAGAGFSLAAVRTFFICVVVLVLAGSHTRAEPSADPTLGFDHDRTTFPLTGTHRNIDCESCHVHGVFVGTPRECGACHNGSLAVGRSAFHVRTAPQCEDCHVTTNFKILRRFDHADAIGTCISCHNGIAANGQPPTHFPTGSTDCHFCHNTRSWR